MSTAGAPAAAACARELPVGRWPPASGTAVDAVAEETAVALSYNGIAHVVMMMTPADLEDFALGFSLSEGIIAAPAELLDCEVRVQPRGIEVALAVSARRAEALKERRRNLAGRTGCGLCGAESLDQALREVAAVGDRVRVPAAAIERALGELRDWQPLQQRTGATHCAAWCGLDGAIAFAREDVGRHNALDKLIGALVRARVEVAGGFALISSRASYEMVTKAARAGIELLVAVSAPTALAVQLAGDAGLTLAGFARPGRFSVYSAAWRIAD